MKIGVPPSRPGTWKLLMSKKLPEGTPIGQAFTRVYMRQAVPLRDSPRVRNRLMAAFLQLDQEADIDVAEYLRLHYGLSLTGPYSFNFRELFSTDAIADVLDAVTGIHGAWEHKFPRLAEQWKKFVGQALAEEGMGYRIDDECGVHLLIDQQFEANRATTVAGLGKSKYQAALTAYTNAMDALDKGTPDTLTAVREVFHANEEVFKLMLGPKVKLLGSSEIEKYLRPLLAKVYSSPDNAVANKMASAYSDWVDGMHTYRHAAGKTEASPPPLDLAVLLVDQGSAHLRWLIGIDGT
jgi:hypothetical protein